MGNILKILCNSTIKLSLFLLTRGVNRWQQAALARQSKIEAKRFERAKTIAGKQGERGESIWRSRSKPIVTCLRLGLIASPTYVLQMPETNPGLFSVFHTVLGFLEFYEENGCGIWIDFKKKGSYYQKDQGENWWEYYFEPIDIGKKKKLKEISEEQKQFFATKGASMDREHASQLIAKYIQLKPKLQKKIDAYVKDHFIGHFIIGVHYRGTDKILEAPRIFYEEVYREIEKWLAPEVKIFVATDEQAFLDDIQKQFPGRVLFIDAIRSIDGKAIHSSRKEGYKKGKQAVLDCVLLSKTNFLIRTSSNLSACSLFFNPHLPAVLL